jgi:uridine monophosphate synthetase
MSTLLQELQQIDVVKYGEFKLKSGLISPVYIDLRHLGCYPLVLKKVGDALWQKIQSLTFDYLCGVPYTALPIATVISITEKIPALLRRKEIKDHGTGRLIEGHYQPGQSCIVIEDVITKGESVLETIADIEQAGLKVKAIATVVDREQGGSERLKAMGYPVVSLFTLKEMIDHAPPKL